MAIRIEGDGSFFLDDVTGTMPNGLDVSFVFYAVMRVDRNAFSTIIHTVSSTDGYGGQLTTNSGGEALEVWSTSGSVNGIALTPTFSLVVDEWVAIGISYASDGSAEYRARALDASDWEASASIADLGTGSTMEDIFFGERPFTEQFNGAYAGLRIWNTELTPEQMLLESHRLSPKRAEDLHTFCPMLPGGTTERLRNFGPIGSALQVSGGTTISDEDMPPIPWGGRILTVGNPVSSSQTVAVGQGSETDTGQAVSRQKSRDVGQSSEADTAQAIAIAKLLGVGQSSETDTGQAVTVGQGASTVAVGQASETDTADSVGIQVNPRVTLIDAWTLVGSSITASPTFAVTSSIPDGCLVARTSSVGGSLRTVTALSYGNQPMTLVDEESTTSFRDAHNALWILDSVDLEAAADTAFDITSDNSNATQFRLQAATYSNVNQAGLTLDNFSVNASSGATPTPEALTTEDRGKAIIAAGSNFGTSDDPDVDVTYSNLTERLESVGSQSYAGIADADTTGSDFTASATYTDTNVGHMLGMSLSVVQGATAVGLASETDTGQAVGRVKARDVGQASETDTGFQVTPEKRRDVGQASETDTALPVTPVAGPGTVVVGQAVETDTGQAISISKTVGVGQGSETDTGQAVAPVVPASSVAVGQASETDTGQVVIPSVDVTIAVGRADEVDTGQAVTPTQDSTVAVGQASETDTAEEVVVTTSGEVAVGLASETDTAQSVASLVPVTKTVGQASEKDSADAVNIIGEDFVAIHEPWTLVGSSINDTPSFAIASGLVRGMLVVRTSSAGATQRAVTVVSYGGQELTKVAEILTTSFRDLQTAVWVLDQAGIDAAVTDEFEFLTDNTEATQFRIQAAVYSNVNQVAAVADSFTATASGGGLPTAEALSTEDGGRVLLVSGSNFGTGDDPDVDVTYNNVTERLESVGTQLYAGIADAEADGTDFTPSANYIDTNVGHMIGLSFRIGAKTVGTGQAEETDTGQAVALQRQVLVTQAAETDAGLTITPSTGTNVAVGQASEIDSSQTVIPATPGLRAVGQALETDTALSVTPRLSVSVPVGPSTETDTAQSISTIRQRLVGTAAEIDTARTIIGQESGVVTLQDRQKEAGAGKFGRDRLAQATKLEAMRLKRLRLIRERDDEDLLALIPAIAKALLR